MNLDRNENTEVKLLPDLQDTEFITSDIQNGPEFASDTLDLPAIDK